jgi:hypothetical protein
MSEQLEGPAPSESAKPSAGTPAIVDVHAESRGGEVFFWHEWRWQNGQSQGKGTIKIPRRLGNDPGTPIHYHLHDETDRGLRFSEDGLGSIWVKRSDCPSSKCGDSQIPESKIRQAPNLLKVFDENSEECTLHYRLRFTAEDGQPESYDPDITNGGKI